MLILLENMVRLSLFRKNNHPVMLKLKLFFETENRWHDFLPWSMWRTSAPLPVLNNTKHWLWRFLSFMCSQGSLLVCKLAFSVQQLPQARVRCECWLTLLSLETSQELLSPFLLVIFPLGSWNVSLPIAPLFIMWSFIDNKLKITLVNSCLKQRKGRY